METVTSEVAATGMTAINTALTSVLEYVGTILDAVTGNPVLVVLFAAGVILPCAIGVFARLVRIAK